jgi:prolyl 4-hydroxylase
VVPDGIAEARAAAAAEYGRSNESRTATNHDAIAWEMIQPARLYHTTDFGCARNFDMYAGFFDFAAPLVWTVEDVLSPSECEAFVERMRESEEVHVAPITGHAGEVIDVSVRNNTRLMFDDVQLAANLWGRVAPHVPSRLLNRPVVGVNERFRIYRYGEGQKHGSHWDSSIELGDGRTSLLTFMIYLNDVKRGGETRFDELHETITPHRGRGLFFQHRIVHTAQPVLEGAKFALRSEIFHSAE